MRKVSIFAVSLALMFLQGCGGGSTGGGELERGLGEGDDDANQATSRSAFSTTVYPLTVENCADCHRPNATTQTQSPFHAHDDMAEAHDEILRFVKVNFSDIPSSRMVLKLRQEQHYCWSDDCDADADQMQTAIEIWASQMNGEAPSVDGGEAGGSDAPSRPVEYNFDRQASALAYSTTVHPLALDHCIDCHRPNGITSQQAPFHAHSDYTIAHESVVDSARVDFANISNSRLVVRLRDDAHYCWTDDCEADADEMQAAIEEWVSQLDLRGVGEVSGARTSMNTIASADIRLPETIKGSIVMQAESATLSGRFKTKQNSQASDFLYIGTDFPPAHPIEGTARVPSINFNGQGCRPPSAEDLQDTITGPFRIREDRRHVDQTGYRYYSQLVKVAFIRPHLRDEYRQAVLNGDTGAALERFILTTGGPEDADMPDGVLDGNTYTRNVVRVLPEFEDLDFLNNTLHGDTAEANRDFFAPRFGNSGTEFWMAGHDETRANLANSLKLGHLYDEVYDRYRRFFFDSNSNDQEWVAQNRLRDVPFTLRRLLDAEGTPFEENNITSSQTFLDYYLGGLTRENALDDVGGMARIDTYIYYYMEADDRAFGNFNQVHVDETAISDRESDRVDRFQLDRGDVNLDLANFYTGGDARDLRTIHINNYADIVKPIFTMNACVQCHGDGSNRPQFAQNDNDAAYDAAASIAEFFNVADTRQARAVQRVLDDRHNCGDDAACDSIGNEFRQAISDWNTQNLADQQAAQNSTQTGFVALSEQERTPGRARFNINITEAGVYNVWLKLRTNADNANSFFVRILDAEGNAIDGIGNGDGSNVSESCKRFDETTDGEWEWYTASINNINNRIRWNLGAGEYVLEVVEREVGADLDMIAISANPEFNPAQNLIDESNIQNNNPKILEYSLVDYVGEGQFEIEVIEDADSDAYVFRNPRFRGVNSNLVFSNIRILVNDQYEFTNSTYTQLDRVVDGRDSGILTSAPLVALVAQGAGVDVFSFVFEDLARTNQPVEPLDDDASVPIDGRQCLNVELFANTVMPVLNNFKLMMKSDYIEYAEGEFPGTDGEDISNPTIYNCTTCHTEEHPYFKMTTFAEGLSAGEPIPQDGLEELCSQALSRVDFGNFDRSLLLRGLNGTFNHPKLHFIQRVGFTGNGNSRAFTTSATDPSGYDSEFIGLRFDKWTANDLNLNAYSGQDLAFLQRYVGRYQQIRYQVYRNALSLNDGEIMTDNDVIVNAGTINEDLIRNDGTNLYSLRNPVDDLDDFNNLDEEDRLEVLDSDPINGDAPWKLRTSCVGVEFTNTDGLVYDSCNNSVNVVTEFENVKQVYREAIINWMNEEKSAYDALND